MKNFKTGLIGVILGFCIGASVPVVANQIYEATLNTFPVIINGEKEDIEGYNIEGTTYFKLRDLGGSLGFNVYFKDGEIKIDTDYKNSKQVEKTTNQSSGADEIKRLTPPPFDDYSEVILFSINGVETRCVSVTNVNNNYLKNMYFWVKDKTDEGFTLYLYNRNDKEKTAVLSDIPYFKDAERTFITEDYLNKVILPLDASLGETTE